MQNSNKKGLSATFALTALFVTMILLVPVVPAADGSVIASDPLGSETDTADQYVAAGPTVLKLNETGEVVWEKDLHLLGKNVIISVIVTSDGFIGVGQVVAKFNFDGGLVWEKNLNPSGVIYCSVTEVSDGFVCVSSNDSSKGSIIFTKFSTVGELIWQQKYESQNMVSFKSIATVQGGVIAAGGSMKLFNGPILVKYDNNGNMVWEKKPFSLYALTTSFSSISPTTDGFVTVNGGSSLFSSDENRKLVRINASTITNYDNDGTIVWSKTFNPEGTAQFSSILTVNDGYVAVGKVYSNSFGKDVWADTHGQGGESDALIVKFDTAGNPIWWKNFGGSDADGFDYVVSVPNGVIAVGKSNVKSFGSGDWAGVSAKKNGGLAKEDIIAVKYDASGNVMWAQNYDGPSWIKDVISAFLWVIVLMLAIAICSLVAVVFLVKWKLDKRKTDSKSE